MVRSLASQAHYVNTLDSDLSLLAIGDFPNVPQESCILPMCSVANEKRPSFDNLFVVLLRGMLILIYASTVWIWVSIPQLSASHHECGPDTQNVQRCLPHLLWLVLWPSDRFEGGLLSHAAIFRHLPHGVALTLTVPLLNGRESEDGKKKQGIITIKCSPLLRRFLLS